VLKKVAGALPIPWKGKRKKRQVERRSQVSVYKESKKEKVYFYGIFSID
jgi:hypothetical protein